MRESRRNQCNLVVSGHHEARLRSLLQSPCNEDMGQGEIQPSMLPASCLTKALASDLCCGSRNWKL